MSNPSSRSVPPIEKTPFVIADALVLLAALFLVWTGPSPLGTPEILGLAALAFLGTGIALAPAILGFQRREKEAALARENRLAELVTEVGSVVRILSENQNPPAPVTPPASEIPALRAQLDSTERALTLQLAAARAALEARLGERDTAQADLLAEARATLRRTQETALALDTATAGALARLAAPRDTTPALDPETLTARVDQQLSARLAALESRLLDAQREHLTAESAGLRASIDAALAPLSAPREPAPAIDPEALAARLESRLAADLSALESRLLQAIRQQIATEIAEERAAALHRAVTTAASAAPLEASQLPPPAGKSRLGRGLGSLIQNPLARPVPTDEPELPLTPAAEREPPAPAAEERPPAGPAVPETLPVDSASLATEPTAPAEPALPTATPSAPVAETPSASPAPAPAAEPTPPAAMRPMLDPFAVPANPYGDIGDAMDALYASSSAKP